MIVTALPSSRISNGVTSSCTRFHQPPSTTDTGAPSTTPNYHPPLASTTPAPAPEYCNAAPWTERAEGKKEGRVELSRDVTWWTDRTTNETSSPTARSHKRRKEESATEALRFGRSSDPEEPATREARRVPSSFFVFALLIRSLLRRSDSPILLWLTRTKPLPPRLPFSRVSASLVHSLRSVQPYFKNSFASSTFCRAGFRARSNTTNHEHAAFLGELAKKPWSFGKIRKIPRRGDRGEGVIVGDSTSAEAIIANFGFTKIYN